MTANFRNRFIVLLPIFLLCHKYGAADNTIVLNVDSNHQGDSFKFTLTDKCVNIPEKFLSRITSVNTNYNCVRLYDNQDCTGTSIEVMARTPAHYDLTGWNFNDKAVSAGPCRNECSANVTGPKPPKEGVHVTIYSHAHYEGIMETLTVQGCTMIPRKFGYRIGSINTTDGKNCYQLYNNVDCTFKDKGDDSIELRPGTPYHEDLRYWFLDTVVAISHCSMKCPGIDVPLPTPAPEPKNENQVVIFDEIHHKGNSLLLEVKEGQCSSLQPFFGWEGAANSVKVWKQSCVTLHTTVDCKNDNVNDYRTLQLHSSEPDLLNRNFSAVTRAISGGCKGGAQQEGKPSAQSRVASTVSGWTITIVMVVMGIVGAGVALAYIKWRNPNQSIFKNPNLGWHSFGGSQGGGGSNNSMRL